MISTGRLLHQRSAAIFSSIHGDRKLLKRITEDMLENGGHLAPLLHWQIIEKCADELEQGRQYSANMTVERYEQAFEAMYQSSDQFLDAWIGSTGCQKLTNNQFQKVLPFLTRIDNMQLFQEMQASPGIDWRYTDLGTVIDVNLLNSYLKTDSPYILEVGGGYGRLAEAVMNIFSGVKYVMLDAVPGSLMFAYLYLQEQLPQKKIGFYYYDNPFDMEQYDLYICPSWHFERLNRNIYDAAINLSSFQEMGQEHVDYYLNLFDRFVAQNGIIYVQNSRDYVFSGAWNYPKTWERLYMYNSPMSWTPVYPIELFRKQTTTEHLKSDAFIEAGYFYSIDSQRSAQGQLRRELDGQKKDNAALNEAIFTLSRNMLPEAETTNPYLALQQLSAYIYLRNETLQENETQYEALCQHIFSLLPEESSGKGTDPYLALQQLSEIICAQKTAQREQEMEYEALCRHISSLFPATASGEVADPYQMLQKVSSSMHSLQEALMEEKKRCSSLGKAYDAVLHSKSWRMTAPLRRLLHALKRN